MVIGELSSLYLFALSLLLIWAVFNCKALPLDPILKPLANGVSLGWVLGLGMGIRPT